MSDTNTNKEQHMKWQGSNMRDSQRVTVPEQLGVNGVTGEWVYPSGEASGHIQVELPSLEGNATPTETFLLRDFGPHVAAKLESAMNASYLRRQNPGQVLRHYAACARGASLMDEAALRRMDDLANDFEKEPETRQFFAQVVRPYLLTLAPTKKR